MSDSLLTLLVLGVVFYFVGLPIWIVRQAEDYSDGYRRTHAARMLIATLVYPLIVIPRAALIVYRAIPGLFIAAKIGVHSDDSES